MKCKKLFCAGLAASMALTLPAQAAGKPLSAYPVTTGMPSAFTTPPEALQRLAEQLSTQNLTAFGALDFSRLNPQTLNTLNTLRAFGMTDTDIASAVQTAAAADTTSSDSNAPASDTNDSTGTDGNTNAGNESASDTSAAGTTDTNGENNSDAVSENTDASDSENTANDAGGTQDTSDDSTLSDANDADKPDHADDHEGTDISDDTGAENPDSDSENQDANPEAPDNSDTTNDGTENTAPEETPGHESEDDNKEPVQDTDNDSKEPVQDTNPADKSDPDVSLEENNPKPEEPTDTNTPEEQDPAEENSGAINPETPAEEPPDENAEPGIDEQLPDEEEILTDEEEILAEEPIIRVVVKDVGRIAVNPYRMKIPVNGGTSCEQIINTEQVLVSTSNVSVAVNVTAIGRTASGSHAIFVKEPPSEDALDKEIFLYAEFLPCESESGEADWSGVYRNADNQLVVTSDGQSKDAVMILDASIEENPVYGAYRIFGSLSEHPSERWTADDTIRVNLAFTFTQISGSNP